MPYYFNANNEGLKTVQANPDGYSIQLIWNKAYPSNRTNSIAYNIYISTDPLTFASEEFNIAPSYVSVGTATSATINSLTPGQLYHFAVRAVEYNPSTFNFNLLPTSGGLHYYPYSLLTSNITATSTLIPLFETTDFPPSGVIKLGAELIYYTSISGNSLVVPGGTAIIDGYVVNLGPTPNSPPRNWTNVGTGTINNLTLVSGNVFTETWSVLCVYADSNPNNAKFEAIGSISGNIRQAIDGYGKGGDGYVWSMDGYIVSNGILSFSITQTTPFAVGDSFTLKTYGGIPGVGSGRGWNNTTATQHLTDGYDGYIFWDPNAIFFPVDNEETNTVVYEGQNRFDIVSPNFNVGSQGEFISADGYHQKTQDLLNSDLSGSDANPSNSSFPTGYYYGYQRTDPVALLTGACVGSYIGGYQYCADGYAGVGQLRGLNLQVINNQRQEELLTMEGEPVCLLKRNWTGITCDCYIPGREYPENRCPKCYGGGIVVSYQQFFNPRRADSRILVRFNPADDKVDMLDTGLESVFDTNGWTLVFPAIHERDILVRFDEDGNREFRYEVLAVSRNKMLVSLSGAQKMQLKRIRKTDAIYQVPAFNDTSQFPTQLDTSIGGALPALPPHSHKIMLHEKSPLIFEQITSINQGHSHPVVRDPKTGIYKILPELGHTHQIIFPPISIFPPSI